MAIWSNANASLQCPQRERCYNSQYRESRRQFDSRGLNGITRHQAIKSQRHEESHATGPISLYLQTLSLNAQSTDLIDQLSNQYEHAAQAVHSLHP